ncbi:M61 family peptidase [Dyella sp.]|uniref:M61 family metallopeptidase n=1 Tax=Dyella sp. TaxID=1869338 RepID=UPI002D799DAB|nr:M61 family peptidase [Dyella sp.]HET6431767.1 M61 family peptidase [Dyella sp.]
MLGSAALSVAAAVASLASGSTVNVDVDASEISRRIVHAKVSLPAKTGPMTFTYPKWIPGDHSPDGTIAGVVNMRITAGKETVAWTRDPVEMFAFHVDVPPKATSIEIAFDFVTPSDGGTLSGSNMGTENVGVINFNQLVFVPENAKSDDVTVKARLTVPKGWGAGTALPGTRKGDVFDFDAASLTTFVDSPVNMGRHFKRFVLDDKHAVSVAAESEAALDVPTDVVTEWRQLVAEAGALFGGARHYRRYEFLVTLSDHVDFFGLEHHESSDNRFAERGLIDDDKRAYYASLLPHEYAHSWNGKFRRPADLWTPTFDMPMQDDLLWVYEGLTDYWCGVLTARAGLWDASQYRDSLASIAAAMAHRSGRAWRSLQDTADAAPLTYFGGGGWISFRRGTDFYPEGQLLWLDVDTRIRELSGNKRSLDDFARAFYGMDNGSYVTKTYTFDDVVNTLNQVQASDWATFLHDRLDYTGSELPEHGIERGGWKLVYTDTPNAMDKAMEKVRHGVNLAYSLGLSAGSNGNIYDVQWDGPAFKAGLVPGLVIVAVNSKDYSPDVLKDAVTAAKAGAPIELLVKNDELYSTYRIDYHDGLKYPHLVRAKGSDLLGDIATARK